MERGGEGRGGEERGGTRIDENVFPLHSPSPLIPFVQI